MNATQSKQKAEDKKMLKMICVILYFAYVAKNKQFVAAGATNRAKTIYN